MLALPFPSTVRTAGRERALVREGLAAVEAVALALAETSALVHLPDEVLVLLAPAPRCCNGTLPALARVNLRIETLDFILDYTKGTPRRQAEVAHMIDTKALQVFAAASIVVGLAAAGPLREGTAAWLFGAALFIYVAAAVAAFCVLRTRDFRVVDDAYNIWPQYWNQEDLVVKHALIDDITSASAENADLLGSKGRALKWLVLATAAEVLLVGSAVIASLS